MKIPDPSPPPRLFLPPTEEADELDALARALALSSSAAVSEIATDAGRQRLGLTKERFATAAYDLALAIRAEGLRRRADAAGAVLRRLAALPGLGLVDGAALDPAAAAALAKMTDTGASKK